MNAPVPACFWRFQYPVELPGVGGMSFLRAAVNARRIEAGEEEVDQLAFVKMVRGKARDLGIDDVMLKRAVNVGFSGGEKKRYEILQMALLEPAMAVLDETDSGLDVDALRVVSEGVNTLRDPEPQPCLLSPITSGCWTISCPIMCIFWQAARFASPVARSWRWRWRIPDMPASMMLPDLSAITTTSAVRSAALADWQASGWPGPRAEAWRFTRLAALT